MTDKIRPPWTPEQVAALNRFQREGGMHAFTCGHEHPAHPNAILQATVDGWRCYVLDCEWEQDWAHAFMADPSAWPQSPFGERHGPTPGEVREAHETACKTIADMHAAAVGEVRGPQRGVVEDVADIRTRALAAEAAVARIRAWIAGQPVTAANEFGNGYREALRDIGDLLPKDSA